MNTDTRIDVAFEIYSDDDEIIDTIDGPGDIGCGWVNGPDSFYELAIIPADYQMAKEQLPADKSLKVIAIPLEGEDLEEVPEDIMEMFMYIPESKDDAINIAKKFNCSYFYFIQWDGCRAMDLIDLETGEEVCYYYNND